MIELVVVVSDLVATELGILIHRIIARLTNTIYKLTAPGSARHSRKALDLASPGTSSLLGAAPPRPLLGSL